MNKKTLACSLTAILVACATGKTEGQKQVEELTGHINKLADDLRTGKAEIQATMAEHNQIVNNEDGNYIGHYQKFATGVDDIEDTRQDAKARLEKIRAAAKPFFERWKNDLAKFSSDEMRKRS